jgi:DNA-binding CsgD family transcriptional regulator
MRQYKCSSTVAPTQAEDWVALRRSSSVNRLFLAGSSLTKSQLQRSSWCEESGSQSLPRTSHALDRATAEQSTTLHFGGSESRDAPERRDAAICRYLQNGPMKAGSITALAGAIEAAIAARTLEWHQGVSHVPAERFQTWVLMGLRSLVPFDRAIWTMEARARPVVLRANGVGSEHPLTSMRHGERIVEHLEPIFRLALKAPDAALNVCLGDEHWLARDFEQMRQEALQSGLMNILCLSSISPTAGKLAQCILISRSNRLDRFRTDEVNGFEQLGRNAMQAFEISRMLNMGVVTENRRSELATAIVDRAGVVIAIEAGFMTTMRTEWPGWMGRRLPEPLLTAMQQANSAHWQIACSRVTVAFSAFEQNYQVSVHMRSALDTLTERERSVAILYATGATYREIAVDLKLAPTTVRGYLRSVFAKLGARNKMQVAARLPRVTREVIGSELGVSSGNRARV